MPYLLNMQDTNTITNTPAAAPTDDPPKKRYQLRAARTGSPTYHRIDDASLDCMKWALQTLRSPDFQGLVCNTSTVIRRALAVYADHLAHLIRLEGKRRYGQLRRERLKAEAANQGKPTTTTSGRP